MINTLLDIITRFIGAYAVEVTENIELPFFRSATVEVAYGKKGIVTLSVFDSGPNTTARWSVEGTRINGIAGEAKNLRHAMGAAARTLSALNP